MWDRMVRVFCILLVGVGLCSEAPGQSDYVPAIELIERDGQWWVLRDGETVKLHGAGVSTQQPHLLDYLANKGGVVTRTWGTKNIRDYLDRAHRNGIGVIVGFWMGHERHGFDYSDEAEVSTQLARAKEEIQAYRDHPAILMWAIGNEAESGVREPDLFYRALSDIVAVTKEEDERRPVITVVAEISQEKIEKLNRIVPWLDGLGINSYGGIRSLGKRVTEYGWKKPFLVTEYGPRGAWEVRKTAWNAPIEPTSSQKAVSYGIGFDAVADHPQCIGSLAFIWGWKEEATPTWYGMFLEGGSRLGAVDVLEERWTGKVPRRRAPVIKSLQWPGDASRVPPGASVEIATEVIGASERTTYTWRLIKEADYRKQEWTELSLEMNQGQGIRFRAPTVAGNYRLSVVVETRRRSAATANVAFRVVEEQGRN